MLFRSAEVNAQLGRLDPSLAELIVTAAEEVASGSLDGEFPLRVWQTGSGTQTNMNVNEVIANRAIELAGGVLGSKSPVHPNDHVNLSQSTNDVYPTAVKLTILSCCPMLLEAQASLREALLAKAQEFDDVIKVGRTQLMDAVPMRLGSEFRAFAIMVGEDIERLRESVLE